MPVNYKLIKKRIGKFGAGKTEKYYAIVSHSGTFDLDAVCEAVQNRSHLNSAAVKSILDSFCYIIRRELQEGRIVQLGELGSFRLTMSSDGVDNPNEFDTNNIRSTSLIFCPGKKIKLKKDSLKFRHVAE
ncbi:MAG: HU family DNA-binding protein [Parabacteroides sp.]|nr:HU family DNA-binding protein [Parabacteroides sp.]